MVAFVHLRTDRPTGSFIPINGSDHCPAVLAEIRRRAAETQSHQFFGGGWVKAFCDQLIEDKVAVATAGASGGKVGISQRFEPQSGDARFRQHCGKAVDVFVQLA